MKIVVVTGSAHKHGTTACLADSFIKGAEDAGHSVYRFDAAFKRVHPCIGCEVCHEKKNGCAFEDDMPELNQRLIEADAIVLVTPIYYFGMTAQLSAVTSRFYAYDDELHGSKKAYLLTAMGVATPESANGTNTTFKDTAAYLGWQNAGIINAASCYTAEDVLKTIYPTKAYELGKSI